MEGTTTNEHHPVCLECRQPLGPGREDRKFCGDACRSAFNNRKRRDAHRQTVENTPGDYDYIRHIQEILLQNRSILQRLYREGEGFAELAELHYEGFNFKYFTSMRRLEEGWYTCCFDYGCLEYENNRYIIMYFPSEITL